MNKKILHISKYYYPDHGGIESVARQVVNGLKDNFDNFVVCFSNDSTDHEDIVDGIKVIRVGVNFSLLSQDMSFGYYRKLKRIMKKYNPDFVHLHCPNPFVYPIVCWLIRPEMKLIVHWHSDILGKGFAYKSVRHYEKSILKRADVVLVTSENYKENSKPLRPFIDKVRILQNGINICNFSKRLGDDEHIEMIRESYGNKPIILFVGRHISYKGIDRLIESEKYIHNDCHILIAGKGPITSRLKHLAEGRDRISFLGRLSDDDLRWYSWAADIFGFASNTKAEAFGVALAEAMFCETTPVVFSIKGSGVNWVSIKDETGLEVPLNDVMAYAAAIDNLIENKDKCKLMAQKAHQRVLENFSEEKIFKLVNEIYQSI